jgi:hypothetical protein
MNTILNKSLLLGKSLFIACLAMGSLAACSDDDDVNLTALNTPSNGDAVATVYTLTFSWDAVANATQYAYELKNEAGDVVSGDVTNKTSVYFSGLRDGATYTLDVWAYAKAYSDQYTRSKVGTFTGTTVATKTLAAPQNLAANEKGTTITWDAVEHAEYYGYVVDNATDTVYTYTTTVTLQGYNGGEHTISVFGVSGDEEYPRAESATLTFTIVKQLLWSVDGNFSRYDGTSSTRTLECYDDGSYKLKNWFDVDGYDLEFTVNGNGVMTVKSNYDAVPYYGYDYYWVETTAWNNGSYLCPAYSSFYIASGYVYFYIWDSGTFSGTTGYDIFEAKTVTADDFVGTYSDESYQWYNNAWYGWGTATVTAEKVDDKTVKFSGIAWNSSDGWTGEIQYDSYGFATGKILFKGGQIYSTWYTLGDYNSADGDVTATFDNNLNITLSDYAFWYGGYAYYYMYTTLTKQ